MFDSKVLNYLRFSSVFKNDFQLIQFGSLRKNQIKSDLRYCVRVLELTIFIHVHTLVNLKLFDVRET